MNDTIKTPASLSLDAFRELMVTIRVSAGAAWNLIDDTGSAGPADLAGMLALLALQRAHPGDDSVTKLELLHSSVRELVTTSRCVAELLGVDPGNDQEPP